MSVDTYLKHKNLSRYNRQRQDDLEVLIAPFLVQAARSITLDFTRGLLRRRFQVFVEPRRDHFHSTACRH